MSVVVSAFNPGNLLVDAIRSALEQTIQNIEIIYVDGGSSDETCSRLAGSITDRRLRIIQQPANRGIAGGYNEGISEARAPWIAILDADDLMHPRRLELQLAALGADPSLDFVSCDLETMDEAGKSLGRMEFLHTPTEIALYATYNMPVAHPGLTGRRTAFSQVRYREEFIGAPDFDLLSRITERYRVAGLAIPLQRWRRHAGSESFAQPDRVEAYACMVRIAAARRRRRQDEGLAGLSEMTVAVVKGRVPCAQMLLRFAGICAGERLHVLACLHAALALRHGGGWRAAVRYVTSLMWALAAEPAAISAALGAVGKAPFWALLKKAGYPAFPRY